MDNQEILKKAEKRVEAKKGFYWHLVVFIVCALFFLFLNLATSPDDIWFVFPVFSWGIGLVFHAVGVFGIPGLNILGTDWEAKQLQKEIDRMREIQHQKEELMMLEEEDEMMNINEKDYIKMKEMRWRE